MKLDIYTQIVLIGFGIAVCWALAFSQAFTTRRTLKSDAWLLFMLAFLNVAGWRLWGLIRLSSTIVEAQAKGYMPEYLTAEQWLQVITNGFGVPLLFIAGMILLRRSLRRLLTTNDVEGTED